MKKSLLTLAFLSLISIFPAFSQDKAPASSTLFDTPSMAPLGKGVFYFGWGYNLDYYGKSDIHFSNHSSNPDERYDFTVSGVGAEDRPGLYNIFNSDIAIPQYAFRIGYFFNRSKTADWGIEINYDHAKYVAYDNQKVHVKGHLAGPNGGVDVDKDSITEPGKKSSGWMHFEHTNGANFALLDVVRRFSFYHTPNQKLWVSAVAKLGAGFMIPRTDCTLFGVERDDKFHLAGYMLGSELAIRADFLKNFYVETAGKLNFVNYTDALAPMEGRAKHHVWARELTLIVGAQFPF